MYTAIIFIAHKKILSKFQFESWILKCANSDYYTGIKSQNWMTYKTQNNENNHHEFKKRYTNWLV